MPARWNMIFAVLFLFPLLRLQAQPLSGRVADPAKTPVPFVSVVLLKDSSFLAATISGDDGSFHFNFPFRNGDAYRLQLSRSGYRQKEYSFIFPDTSFMHALILFEEQRTLEEIRVMAGPPLVARRTDRYIITIENSFLADGHTALEVLQKSPGIWVDARGSIRIKGNQPVLVMINDVVQQLSGDELADYLRSLRSEDISRIEVIPNPPAEFEAAGAGGIIHIVLKKGRKDGWNASITAQYRQQGDRPYATAGSNFNYGHRKLSLTGSYTITKDLRYTLEKADIEGGGSYYHNITGRWENIFRNQYRIGITYDLSAAQSLDLQAAFSRTRFGLEFAADELFSGTPGPDTAVALSNKSRLFNSGNATLNYNVKLDTSGASLRLIADYTQNEKNEHNDFDRQFTDGGLNARSRNEVPVRTTVYTAQADYTKPLHHKTILKSGIKWARISRDNGLFTEDYENGSWIKNALQTDHFVYTESNLMFYSTGEGALGKISMKAGLRAEQTFAKGVVDSPALHFSRSYSGLFPSLFLTRPIDLKKGSSLSFNYTRRLTRPSLSDLNPARLAYSNYTALRGNPYLRPQYAHNFSFAYVPARDYTAEIYLIKTFNYIALSALRTGNVIEYLSENVGSTAEWGFSVSGTTKVLSFWTMINNAAVYASSYRYKDRQYKQVCYYAKSVQLVSFRKGVEMDVVADYRSPYVYTNLYTYGNFSLDAGLSKKIGSKARLRFAVSDIFNSLREQELTEDGDTRIFFYRKRPTRTAALSFTWNFSRGKTVSNRKIDGGAAEERGRIGN